LDDWSGFKHYASGNRTIRIRFPFRTVSTQRHKFIRLDKMTETKLQWARDAGRKFMKTKKQVRDYMIDSGIRYTFGEAGGQVEA
jgi:hypothetical protein